MLPHRQTSRSCGFSPKGKKCEKGPYTSRNWDEPHVTRLGPVPLSTHSGLLWAWTSQLILSVTLQEITFANPISQ